ncbi:MAG: hypothetical protein K0R54_59 [Clostridiaceae bacterium]|jgi:cellulose biosynthesis protein BcsQ|nr:hypothetical protein [Clostridiaceae bacterium]
MLKIKEVLKYMEKILLAVGFRQLEEYIEKQLKKEFLFVGTTVYREGILRAIGQKNPDIVIIRETLEGRENILSLIYEIRGKFPRLRIVFIAGKREPGDALLATLVSYGIYDILQGEKIQAQEVISLIRKPNEYKDVKHLQPAPVLDEKSNKVLFQAPEAIVKEKEIIKEIYIGNETGEANKDSTSIQSATTDIKLDDKEKPEPQKTTNIKTSKPTQEQPLKHGFLSKFKGKNDVVEIQNTLAITKQKIITFMGSKSGVGNSVTALNTATLLAQRGLKTIYIELNERTPSVSYWYELGYIEDGIDSAIIALQDNNYKKVNDAIISSKELKKTESSMQKNYKKLPDSLDFMFFSKKYLTKDESIDLQEPLDMSLSKELYLYLIFQAGYDFIILDVPANISNDISRNALIYSNKVFVTITQDISTIGYSIYNTHELDKKGLSINNRMHYILNKFEKTDLSIKEIEDWIQTKEILTIPLLNKEYINSSFIGIPISLYSKNQNLKSSFQKIVEKIIK